MYQVPLKMVGTNDTKMNRRYFFPPEHRSWFLKGEWSKFHVNRRNLGQSKKYVQNSSLSACFFPNMHGMTLEYWVMTKRAQESLFTKKITGNSFVS